MRNRLRIAPNPDAQTCRAPHPASQSVPESERHPTVKTSNARGAADAAPGRHGTGHPLLIGENASRVRLGPSPNRTYVKG